MRIDETLLSELIEESQDQQVDAMRQMTTLVPDLRDLANDRRHDTLITPDEIRTLQQSRSTLKAKLGMIAGAGAVGVSAIDNNATQAPAKRFTPSKAEFQLNDHQQLRKMLLGQESIQLPLR